jgi:NAD(P)-dependent dehydrogenase (short-subunit alcohol dehydrogenase family)
MMLEGKAGVITGGAQGLGKTYALGAAREGANVVLRDVAGATPTASSPRRLTFSQ